MPTACPKAGVPLPWGRGTPSLGKGYPFLEEGVPLPGACSLPFRKYHYLKAPLPLGLGHRVQMTLISKMVQRRPSQLPTVVLTRGPSLGNSEPVTTATVVVSVIGRSFSTALFMCKNGDAELFGLRRDELRRFKPPAGHVNRVRGEGRLRTYITSIRRLCDCSMCGYGECTQGEGVGNTVLQENGTMGLFVLGAAAESRRSLSWRGVIQRGLSFCPPQRPSPD